LLLLNDGFHLPRVLRTYPVDCLVEAVSAGAVDQITNCMPTVFNAGEKLMLRIDLALSTPVTNRFQAVCALNSSRAGSVLAPSYQLPGPRRSIWGFTTTQLRKPIRQLANERWLELRRHRGAIVCERGRLRTRPDARERFARPLPELVARALGEGLSRKALAREMIESTRKLEKTLSRN
jgi:hypothetical protein